jgi:hypothetical protein
MWFPLAIRRSRLHGDGRPAERIEVRFKDGDEEIQRGSALREVPQKRLEVQRIYANPSEDLTLTYAMNSS